MDKPANKIIEKYFNQTCSFEERKMVLKWFGTPEGQQFLSNRMDDDILSMMMHNCLPSNMLVENTENKTCKTLQLKKWKYWGSAAAVVLLAIALRFLLTMSSSPAEFTELYIPQGMKEKIVLEDSSVIWVNADTKIKYPSEGFKKNRVVYVEGYTFFQSIITNPAQ